MAKAIPLRSKSLTNLQSLAAPAHPQPYTRVTPLVGGGGVGGVPLRPSAAYWAGVWSNSLFIN